MATGDTYLSIGTTLKYVSGKPATLDQTGVDALSGWDEIGGVAELPDRGDEPEDVSEAVLSDGRVEHFPGQIDGGTLTIPIKHIEGDAGQAAMLSAATTNTTYTFQEVDPDGEATFYYGRVMAMKRRASPPNSFKGYQLMIAVNSARFVGTEAS